MDYSVIKEGDLFLVTDKSGDVAANNESGYGLYTKDTRFLSRMELLIDGQKPTLLSSSADKSYFASIRLMKDRKDEGAIEIHRERFINDGALYERVSLTNFFPKAAAFEFTAAFDADFQDMFIVRKYRTGDVGQIIGREAGEKNYSIRYLGADEIVRETRIEWDEVGSTADSSGRTADESRRAADQNGSTADQLAGKPGDSQRTADKSVSTAGHQPAGGADENMSKAGEAAGEADENMSKADAAAGKADEHGQVRFDIRLEPKETKWICFRIIPVAEGEEAPGVLGFEQALQRLEQSYEKWYCETTRVTTDSDVFNGLYARGVQDLRMLMTDIGHGETPVAGLPWFAVPFGRDSLITSLFMLPLNPHKVKGTLLTLAAYQGESTDAWRDEQPGKIMHEIRFGELVNTKQSPFAPYYGTVDATPLFLVLIGEYVRWTGDLALVEQLKPNIERALEWIDRATEAGAGFVTYHQEAEKGFPNQGWKDSSNSIVHQSGEYAMSPIALSEVQGYVYQAKKGLVPVFARMGQQALADKLEREAEALRTRFEQEFWMEEEQFYAIALDKERQKVQSVTSNPGHLLMTGLPEPSRAEGIAARLTGEDMFNGYGIRTMSTDAAGYYPMSYHNGSVWPHDNAMILLGLSRLGYKQAAGKVISGLLEASRAFEYQRLPELFCGHGSKTGHPVPYPTTCSPQAWAAATSVVFLQAMLGLNPNALTKQIAIDPFLPAHMDELLAEHIRIGTGQLSVKVTRSRDVPAGIKVEILENTTGCELIDASKQFAGN